MLCHATLPSTLLKATMLLPSPPTRAITVSPYSIAGAHDSLGTLPAEMVEPVHRMVTDPARLRRVGGRKIHFGRLDRRGFTTVLGKQLRDVPVAAAPVPEPPALPATSTNVYEAEVGDLDGDTDPDMFFVSAGSGMSEGHIRNNWAGSGSLTFTKGSTFSGGDDNEVA